MSSTSAHAHRHATGPSKHAAAPSERTSRPGNDKGCCQVFYVDEERVARVREAMLPDDFVNEVAETFKVLAHPTRVRILRALAKEELCVCDLAQVLGMTVSAASHQLRALRGMKLVRYRMDGKLAYYRLADPSWLHVAESVLEKLAGAGAR